MLLLFLICAFVFYFCDYPHYVQPLIYSPLPPSTLSLQTVIKLLVTVIKAGPAHRTAFCFFRFFESVFVKNFTNGVLALAVGALCVVGCSSTDPVTPSTNAKEIRGVLSITGSWNTLGKAAQAAGTLAQRDLNAQLRAAGKTDTIVWKVVDSKLDPTSATQAVRDAKAAGVRVIVGPQSSAELASMRTVADSLGVIVISPSSTAGTLAIANDNILRLCPPDQYEAEATSSMIAAQGKQYVVIVYREDAGNMGLATETEKDLKEIGIDVVGSVHYPTTTTDFSSIIDNFSAHVEKVLRDQSADVVAVYIPTFTEVKDLIAQIPASDTILKKVVWYGGDGTANDEALLAQAPFLEAVHYSAPAFAVEAPSALSTKLETEILAMSGTKPDAFALAVYDAVWAAGLAVTNTSATTDAATLRTSISTYAQANTGATGHIELDAAGDRSNASYDFLFVKTIGGVAQWVKGGQYRNGVYTGE